ncbi:MAG: hypothetical protein WAO20_15380 [Acidobacteriota bacterium]
MLKRSSLILVLVFAFASLPLFAQNGIHLTANVPFPFIVEGRVLPAGQYSFWQKSANNESDWQIRATKDGAQEQAMFVTEDENSTTPQPSTTIDFVKYGDHYYLSDLWTLEGMEGWHVPVKLEREQLAKNVKPSMVKVPATLESGESS